MILYVVCMYVGSSHIARSMDQPGKVANPARGQLNRENNSPLSPCVPENLVSRDEFTVYSTPTLIAMQGHQTKTKQKHACSSSNEILS